PDILIKNNPNITIRIVFPSCEPANNHFKFTLSINKGVNRLDKNIDVVIVNGTKDAIVADAVKPKIALIIHTIYITSTIFASDCPINNREKFLFNFISPKRNVHIFT